jgi:hypothetical protein
MKRSWASAILLASLAAATPARAQFQGMLDRLENRIGTKVEENLGKRQDKVIDKTFDAGDRATACAASDPGCNKPTGPAKCAASDRACLSKAKANGQQVEITGD